MMLFDFLILKNVFPNLSFLCPICFTIHSEKKYLNLSASIILSSDMYNTMTNISIYFLLSILYFPCFTFMLLNPLGDFYLPNFFLIFNLHFYIRKLSIAFLLSVKEKANIWSTHMSDSAIFHSWYTVSTYYYYYYYYVFIYYIHVTKAFI